MRVHLAYPDAVQHAVAADESRGLRPRGSQLNA